ncbi:hypothetical protein ACFOUZ_09655 [Flavobacterium gossypii]
MSHFILFFEKDKERKTIKMLRAIASEGVSWTARVYITKDLAG